MTTSTPLPEQGGFDERLSEILAAVYLAGTENGLGRSITDPEEIIHRREAFIEANPANKEAKAAIRTLILEEIIGNSPSKMNTDNWKYDRRVVQFQEMQRKKLGDTHDTK